MGTALRFSALLASASALFGGSAQGQELSRIPAPASRQWVADITFRALPGPTYDGASGQADELPYTLDLYQARLDLSYSLSDRVSPGAFVTYRENRYCCTMGSAITEKGISGFGAFVDFLPRKPGSGSPILRLEYEHASRGDGSVLPVSDRQDRLLAFSDWRLLAGRGAFTGVAGRADVGLGFGHAGQKAYYRASGELASGFVLARGERFKLTGGAALGYSVASDDRENGTVFHNRHSTQVHAGAEVGFGFGRGRRNQIRLEAGHDIVSRNALSGWRLGVTFRRRFGAGG